MAEDLGSRWSRASEGDRQTFGRLFELFAQRIYAYCFPAPAISPNASNGQNAGRDSDADSRRE